MNIVFSEIKILTMIYVTGDVPNCTVTIPAGEVSVEFEVPMSVEFEVPMSVDDISEGNSNFTLNIDSSSLPRGVIVGDPGQATVVMRHIDGKLTKTLVLI